ELRRIRPGVYLPLHHWRDLDDDDRYRVSVRAAALVRAPGTQFSHDSAAAMWRLPSLGPWSTAAHTLVGRRAGGASRAGLRCHSFDLDPDPTDIDGVTVTSLPRTLLDVATQPSFTR